MFTSIRLLLFFAGCALFTCARAQVQMPAYTGYAVPLDSAAGEESQDLFNEKAGVQHWTNPQQQLHYFFHATAGGPLTIQLLAKNGEAGKTLHVLAAKKRFFVALPRGNQLKAVPVGTVLLPSAGDYTIIISAVQKKTGTIADIKTILFTGPAAKGLRFNKKPRRNAASVHLLYDVPDSSKAVGFYSELTIPAGADHLYSYYMANGFSRGYFGMQVNSPSERRIIFSVWDAGNEAAERSKVADEDKVELLAKGMDVFAGDFGNEGTGGHSHWVYPWTTDATYRFLVTALPDSASNTTIYTGYFFLPELQQWKLIAAFRAPKDGQYLNGLYSFVENFEGGNGQLQRKALFGNQWIRNEDGQWHEITHARFSYDATGRAGDRTDYGAAADSGRFSLWNGGFRPATAQYKQLFTRAVSGQPPVTDLYKNADSLQQAGVDKQLIEQAVATGKLDTTGSINGVYYKLLKAGTGKQVTATDTVLAFYKGALLNGVVFDQTTDKPATFPLNRLIKGWQLALPQIRVGGSIRIIIPSALAYSIRTRSTKIPPNSVLVFDIEVLEAR